MKRIWVAAVLGLLLAASGCSREHGFSRSAFNTKFLDKTVEEAQDAAGKPDSVETPDANTVVLVYNKRTFDQENGNAKDAAVRVTFKKAANGKMMHAGTEFVSG